MKLSFDYKGIKVTYYLTYKKAKAISIKITEDGQVKVIAPLGTSVFAVMDKVKGNAPWIINEIYNKTNSANENIQTHVEKVPMSESKLLDQYMYLGKNYKLELTVNPEAKDIKVKMVRGRFVVETATESEEEIRSAIVEWYKQKVKAKINERFKAYGNLFETVPNEIELIDNNEILFTINTNCVVANAKLGILPAEAIDYVLVSGLCGINDTDEASRVKKLEEVLPNYQKGKEWLEANKSQLIL